MIGVQADVSDDAQRWWEAYILAGHDDDGELRQRAGRGDDHARWQLASWLSDRGRMAEAIAVVRPLADAGDDVAELYLARWLADEDRGGELRQRAAAGGYHALCELARWLAGSGDIEGLREVVVGADDRHRADLMRWLASDCRTIQLAGELGDDDARARYERWLARLKDRAAAGKAYARELLAELTE